MKSQATLPEVQKRRFDAIILYGLHTEAHALTAAKEPLRRVHPALGPLLRSTSTVTVPPTAQEQFCLREGFRRRSGKI
eukprot:3559703-Amphidinium_carterae.1